MMPDSPLRVQHARPAQQAWHSFLDMLRGADRSWLDTPRLDADEITTAIGYRNLTHLVSYGFDLFMESDPDWPELVPLAAPIKKLLGDNTDSVYFYAGIRGDRRYRIVGQRGEECYLSVIVHAGPDPASSMSQRTIANLNHRDLVVDAVGRFEIILSPESDGRPPDATNWMPLTDDARCVITREYYFDRWHNRRAQMQITCLDDIAPSRPWNAAETADRIGMIHRFVEECTRMVPMDLRGRNEVQEPFQFTAAMPSWGTPDNVYSRCAWQLADDEALIIEGRVVPCVYWGIQLWNPFMQSLDWRYHRVSINNRQAKLGDDGSFRVVISPAFPDRIDPAGREPNWISTAGHHQGALFCRWLCADEAPPRPRAHVVKVDELFA